MAVKTKTQARSRRHARLRKKVVGTELRPLFELLGADTLGGASDGEPASIEALAGTVERSLARREQEAAGGA